MAYKRINRVKNKFVISFILCLVSGIGIYSIWSYEMNYEMIMRYTDLDENAPDFPFGQKKVDARYWILEKNFSKIDDYRIYNPRVKPLEKNQDLKNSIKECIEDSKIIHPEVYKKFNNNEIIRDIKKDLLPIYLFSVFNEHSQTPDEDTFLIQFDGYEAMLSRKNNFPFTTYICSNIDKKGTYELLDNDLFKKLKIINPRFPEYLNK